MIAKAVARSTNEKIGDCATTYAAQASCPSSCVFKDGGGCYAEYGRMAVGLTNPLNRGAALVEATPLDVAEAEALAIDEMATLRKRPLRLHTVGDCATDEAARIVAAAAERYMDRGGGPVWTYTHAWRDVDRASWGRVSVLASCENVADVAEARARGYAPSIVVEEFADRKRYSDSECELLPCPAQTTENVACSSCRLCMDDQGLLERGYAIAFAVHGSANVVKAAVRALRDPDDPDRKLTTRDHAHRLREELGRWPRPHELAERAGVTKSSAWQMMRKLEGVKA